MLLMRNVQIAPVLKTNHSKHIKVISALAELAMSVQNIRSSRFAASIVYQNEVVSIGTNRMKSSPLQAKYSRNNESIFLHAEIDAIGKAKKELSFKELEKSTLYICRVKYVEPYKTSWQFGLAKPCLGCYKAIKDFGIKTVMYTTDENGIEYL